MEKNNRTFHGNWLRSGRSSPSACHFTGKDHLHLTEHSNALPATGRCSGQPREVLLQAKADSKQELGKECDCSDDVPNIFSQVVVSRQRSIIGTLAIGTETISYDLDHNGTPDFTRVLDRSQDILGRETGFQLKDGTTLENQATYGYSAIDGRLTSIGGGDASSPPSFTYGYLPNSNLIQTVTATAGAVHDVINTYEPTRNVLVSKQNKVGTTVISQYDYTLNAIGQRTGVNSSGTAFAATPSLLWGYDNLGQVISADSNVNTSDRAYQYDAIGNRRKSADSLTLPSSDNYASNALNQYTSRSVGLSPSLNPEYDDDGNATAYPLPAAPTTNSTLVWDAENRMISDTVGASTNTYLYDALSRRIAKTSSGVANLCIYDGWNCITEYTGTTLSKTRLWGLDLSGSMQGAGGVGGLLAENGTNHYYPTYDGNGNVSEYLDSTGSITAHFEYDPFGNTVINTDTSNQFAYRFSTKPLDFETGLYYYGYRYYDPLTGRWPSRDPIGENGGINLYGFAGNDGVIRWDYLGLWKPIQRKGDSWAKTCAEQGDTWPGLAGMVHLLSNEAPKWVNNYDGAAPTPGKDYLVPNTVAVYTAKNTDLAPGGIATMAMLRRAVSALAHKHDKLGYKIVRQYDQSSVPIFEELWKEEGLYRIAFSGHGKVFGKGGPAPYWAYWADPVGDNVSIGPIGPLRYKLNTVFALHCGANTITNYQNKSMNVIAGKSPAWHDWDDEFEIIIGGIFHIPCAAP